MRLRRIIPALFPFLFAQSALAGAWTQAEGKGLFIGQATYFASDKFFDQDGQEQRQPTFRKFELQPYVEYGVKDWLTVGGSTYLQRVNQSDDDNWGIADTELFARLRLWKGETRVISIQPLIKLPSEFSEGGTPRGGSRAVDAELSLLYGRSMKIFKKNGYTDMRVGYRVRGRGLNPQWRVDAAAGIFVTEDIQLIPAFRSVVTTKYDETGGFREDGEQDYDLAKAELTAAYHLNERGWMQLTYFEHIAGAFTGAGRGVSLGYAEAF